MPEDRAFVDWIVEEKPLAATAFDGFKSVEIGSVYEAVRTEGKSEM